MGLVYRYKANFETQGPIFDYTTNTKMPHNPITFIVRMLSEARHRLLLPGEPGPGRADPHSRRGPPDLRREHPLGGHPQVNGAH